MPFLCCADDAAGIPVIGPKPCCDCFARQGITSTYYEEEDMFGLGAKENDILIIPSCLGMNRA